MNMKLLKGIQKTVSDFEDLVAVWEKRVMSELKMTIKDIFDEYPELKAIAWLQFTPYWRHGDTCEFGVSAPLFTSKDVCDRIREEDEEYDDKSEMDWGELDLDKSEVDMDDSFPRDKLNALEHIADQFAKLIQCKTMEPIMEKMLGDHMVVIVTPNGIETISYEHD